MAAGWVAMLAGCSAGAGATDAGADVPCNLRVALGTGDRGSFVPLADGDPLEVWLGFQGLRMLVLAVELEGAPATTAELTTHLLVEATDVHLQQVDREVRLITEGDGPSIVEDYLIFVNDAPTTSLIGHTARLEHIARVGHCAAATQVEVELRDDHPCVDTSLVVPDAGEVDGGLLDGAVPCEDDP
jgi:hypothetical protein